MCKNTQFTSSLFKWRRNMGGKSHNTQAQSGSFTEGCHLHIHLSQQLPDHINTPKCESFDSEHLGRTWHLARILGCTTWARYAAISSSANSTSQQAHQHWKPAATDTQDQMSGDCVLRWYSSSGSEPVAITLSGSSGRTNPDKNKNGVLQTRMRQITPRSVARICSPGAAWEATSTLSKNADNNKTNFMVRECWRAGTLENSVLSSLRAKPESVPAPM